MGILLAGWILLDYNFIILVESLNLKSSWLDSIDSYIIVIMFIGIILPVV